MIRSARGFTLMEMLVVLVITALLMTALFQSLGILRRAQERVDVRNLRARQAELAEGWYRASVEGLVAEEGDAFAGDAGHWQASTLQPVQGSPGAPTVVAWRLQADAGGARLEYRSGETPPLDIPLVGDELHFAYIDEAGAVHRTWPPSKGLFPALPAAVTIESGDGAERRVLRYAAVAGPLRPAPVPFEPEADE